MENENKTVVRYIKNGVEKVVILNRWNQNKVFRDIFYQRGLVYIYVLRDEISYLEIKNYKFLNYFIYIHSNKNAIVILDHCCFVHRVGFERGTVQLIEPKFTEANAYISGHLLKEFHLSNICSNDDETSVFVSSTEKFSFDANDKPVYYLGVFNTEEIFLKNIEMNIDNKNACATIVGNRFMDMKNCNMNVKKIQIPELSLVDVHLYCNDVQGLRLMVQKIIGTSFSVVVNDTDLFLNHICFSKEMYGNITLTDCDFVFGSELIARNNLIAFLKTLRDTVLEENHKKSMEIEHKMLKRRIMEYRGLKKKRDL